MNNTRPLWNLHTTFFFFYNFHATKFQVLHLFKRFFYFLKAPSVCNAFVILFFLKESESVVESVELQHSFTSPVEHSGRQNESARRRVKSDGTQGERAAEVRVPGTDKWTGGGKTGSCLRQTSTVTTTIQVHSGGAPSLVPLEGFPLSPFEETTALGFVSHFDLGGSGDGSVGVSRRGVVSVQLAVRRAHHLVFGLLLCFVSAAGL